MCTGVGSWHGNIRVGTVVDRWRAGVGDLLSSHMGNVSQLLSFTSALILTPAASFDHMEAIMN
jgi:hypothetical protein